MTMEGNILDYLDWRGDLTFRQSPVCSVDALIFSSLAYINFNLTPNEERTIGECAVAWSILPDGEKFRGLDSVKSDHLRLLDRCAHSRRYENVVVTHYREKTSIEHEQQFAAVSFILPGGDVFIAFRGTDQSLVGWKEDFNMAFTSETPAQLDATKYTEMIASDFSDASFEIGGHSKGGNLAVWSAVHQCAETRKRIKRVYNNDGPGFSNNLTESPAYLEMKKRISSFVPESSVVGVLMGCCDYLTVKSTAVSVFQHHPFTWKVVGKHFVYDTERSEAGKYVDNLVNNLIKSMGKDDIEELVTAVYGELVSNDEKTLKDLKKHFLRHLFRNITTISKLRKKNALNEKNKKELLDSIKKL